MLYACIRTSIKHVRYYTTKSQNGGIAFKCIYCERTIATTELDRLKGNLRTQAAALMNQHVEESHLSTPPCSIKTPYRGAF